MLIDVAGLCHWVQDRGDARSESHEEFHFGSPCPYAVVAAVLRGDPDPRDAAVRPDERLSIGEVAHALDPRAQIADMRAELAAAAVRPDTEGAETCPECKHIHTPEGCTGPPSPSDLWAGVSPAVCDCADEPPRAARGEGEQDRA